MASEQPIFDEALQRAIGMLGDVENELNSDWRPGTGPTEAQSRTLADALRAIADAKAALDEAVQSSPLNRME
ncbi:hypothetical protein [Arthrobacter mobilis]|uniref:Uncharacterized protein n=1 Tax=Arthrobacter mobilis TaxID=2724944 RepID=A0A7X6QMM3_9MICC|nr:hypothetical protein [Arthrobacter mobilis]NKX56824.1 hypothetical protein [Arthrobacter mobilis]